jgi:hypothetical protein
MQEIILANDKRVEIIKLLLLLPPPLFLLCEKKKKKKGVGIHKLWKKLRKKFQRASK